MGPQTSLAPNYEQLWGMYGNKPGAMPGNPNLLGATASIKANANRFAPGLPTKPLQPDLHRSMMGQVLHPSAMPALRQHGSNHSFSLGDYTAFRTTCHSSRFLQVGGPELTVACRAFRAATCLWA